MLKNKLKLVPLTMLLIISLIFPVVKADEENHDNEVAPISEEQNDATTQNDQVDQSNTTTAEEDTSDQTDSTIKKGDEYLFKDNVTIDYPVDGNIFVCANTVTIDSQIGGDAFICAKTVNITENGYIYSNLFVCANEVNVNGVVYDVYSVSKNLNINGFVYRDIKSVSDSLNINSIVGRNVFANASNINFKEDDSDGNSGSIQGDLNYSSPNELSFPDGAVNGETKYTAIEKNNENNKINISNYIISFAALVVSTVLIWLIGLWISPKLLINKDQSLSAKKVLKTIGLGILIPLIIGIISIILLLIPIATQFIIFLLSILALLFFISTSVTIINISKLIWVKSNTQKTLYKLGILIASTLIFELITLIPYIGGLISVIAVIYGIGTISYMLFVKEKDVKEGSKKED